MRAISRPKHGSPPPNRKHADDLAGGCGDVHMPEAQKIPQRLPRIALAVPLPLRNPLQDLLGHTDVSTTMISLRSLTAIAWFCIVGEIFCSPVTDLSSPSQEIRDSAAKVLRDDYHMPSRKRWEPILAAIKIGDHYEKIMEIIRPFKATPEMCVAGGSTSSENYRLDDLWLLSCLFRTSEHTLIRCGLTDFWRNIWVAPPPHFTGIWTTYYANGQRSHEIHYVNGAYEGAFTTYGPDGSSTSVTQEHNKP